MKVLRHSHFTSHRQSICKKCKDYGSKYKCFPFRSGSGQIVQIYLIILQYISKSQIEICLRRKSGQERTAEYRKNIPDKVKLTKEIEKLDTLKKRVEDEQFDEEVKRKERERKKAYRAKKASGENKEIE